MTDLEKEHPLAVAMLVSIRSMLFAPNSDNNIKRVISLLGEMINAIIDARAFHPTVDAPAPETGTLTVGYTNWRGEYAVRCILPKGLRYGSTQWHLEPQWLLRALDLDKGEEREFALKNFGAETEGNQTKSADTARCFECSTPLAGPICPRCNPSPDMGKVRDALTAAKTSISRLDWRKAIGRIDEALALLIETEGNQTGPTSDAQ